MKKKVESPLVYDKDYSEQFEDNDLVSKKYVDQTLAPEENIDVFTPTNGQAVFTLSNEPKSDTVIFFMVNGIEIESFTVDGAVITYTGTEYELADTDYVKFVYFT